jgi:hypothetical protein
MKKLVDLISFEVLYKAVTENGERDSIKNEIDMHFTAQKNEE